jgi:hypothetical protein
MKKQKKFRWSGLFYILFALILIPAQFSARAQQSAAPKASFFAPWRAAGQASSVQQVNVAAQAAQPIVGQDYNHDISPALRDIPPAPPPKAPAQRPQPKPLLQLPNRITNQGSHQDPVVQGAPATPNMPSAILNFDGIPFPGVNCNCAPPDTNGEVGLTQYMQIVNEGIQVFDKTSGASVFGPVGITTLWTGFGGVCETSGFGDPVVLYDQLANRWVVTQFAGTSIPTDECIAVSTSSDATGSYARYGFHLGTDFFDYPKLGVWPDAYYMGMNVFNSSGTAFLGPQPFAFDRDAMLAGNPATFITFRDPAFFNPSSDQFMPADLDGIMPPPAGAPNPFLSTGTNSTWPLYHFHVDFANPANSSFTLASTLTPDPFTVLTQNVPQLGTTDTLDNLADRGMFRSAYRNFGDHEALVGNMTVSSNGVAGIRWFEVDNVTSGTASFVQQSTYQPDTTWRWMGSAAMDGNGNLALGFSASDATINPQIRYAGRLATDPPNTLGQGETHLFDGTGSQTDTVSRWGDYSDMTVDPVDDCTFWYTQEYYSVTSSFNWRTRIGNFKFPSCTTAPSGSLQGTVTDASNNNPIAGAQISVAPIGASTATDANGHYSLTLPVGTYDVTASAFGYSSQTVTGVSVTDGGTTTQDFALTAAPSHTVSGHVYGFGNAPIENATVTILGTPIPPATTDANGAYSFANVPEGTYDVKAEAGGCSDPLTQQLVVNADETLDFNLQQRSDSFGYFCQIQTPAYVEGTTSLGLSGDDSYISVPLPFDFTFYGQTYNTAYMCTNGYLNFLAGNCFYSNTGIPNTGAPNAAIYPYWDDLIMDASSSTWSDVLGSAPDRSFIMEWRNATYFGDSTRRVDFEVILHENGQIQTEYRNIANDGREQGNSATVGIENAAGDVALQYSFDAAAIGSPDFAVLYRLPPSAFVEGHVTDANDNQPVAGASVEALLNNSTVRQTTTDADGFYRMQLLLDTYTIQASATNYSTDSATVVMDTEDQTYTQDFALKTARVEVSPGSLQFVVTPDKTRTQTLTLSNTGSLSANWQIRETGGGMVTTSSTAVLQKNPSYDPNARTTQGLYTVDTPPGWSPSAPGDVISSWSTGLTLGWGVGYQGNVWLSDIETGACGPGCIDHEFDVNGTPTGRSWPTTWAGAWPGDMAYDASRGIMCQVNVGGDNGIYCFDPNTGNVAASITGSFPWAGISQRGLAYRPDDDSFYIGGWNEGILYHIQGLSGANPGAVISQCNPPDGNISGLAWNSAAGIVWEATNSPTDTIYELNPDTCAVLNTLPHPNPGYNGAGLAMDEAGNLWMIGQSPNTAYLVDSGVPSFTDVPWLSEDPTSGTIDPGSAQQVAVTVDTTGLAPGVYMATLFVDSNSGRQPIIEVPVQLVVPAYQTGVNAGDGVYTDSLGDTWMADQAYTDGSWGYMNDKSKPRYTKLTIGGTSDSLLYQYYREDPSEYRFDGLPSGVYEIDLRFTEPNNMKPGKRIFDVIAEGNLVIPSLDIAYDVGDFYADNYTLFVPVTDGELNLRLVSNKSYAPAIISAIRVTNRPDK